VPERAFEHREEAAVMQEIRETVVRLRRQYQNLAESRAAIEHRMLRSREYFEGSIATIEHKNKGGTSTPYYYISCPRDEGRTALYIRRKDLARARKLVGNWQAFKRNIERCEELNQEMARIARQIVALQTVEDLRNDE
jgi:hypothetical protein